MRYIGKIKCNWLSEALELSDILFNDKIVYLFRPSLHTFLCYSNLNTCKLKINMRIMDTNPEERDFLITHDINEFNDIIKGLSTEYLYIYKDKERIIFSDAVKTPTFSFSTLEMSGLTTVNMDILEIGKDVENVKEIFRKKLDNNTINICRNYNLLPFYDHDGFIRFERDNGYYNVYISIYSNRVLSSISLGAVNDYLIDDLLCKNKIININERNSVLVYDISKLFSVISHFGKTNNNIPLELAYYEDGTLRLYIVKNVSSKLSGSMKIEYLFKPHEMSLINDNIKLFLE